MAVSEMEKKMGFGFLWSSDINPNTTVAFNTQTQISTHSLSSGIHDFNPWSVPVTVPYLGLAGQTFYATDVPF